MYDMKAFPHSYLLGLILVVNFVRTASAPYPDKTVLPIHTDKEIYKVRQTRNAVEVTIKYTYTNRIDGTVYLTGCQEVEPPSLEKKIGGKWVLAYYEPAPLPCIESRAISHPIKSGESYEHTFELGASLSSNGPYFAKFRVQKVEGIYRLVQSIYSEPVVQPVTRFLRHELKLNAPLLPPISRPIGRGDDYEVKWNVPLLPLEERISNEIKLTR